LPLDNKKLGKTLLSSTPGLEPLTNGTDRQQSTTDGRPWHQLVLSNIRQHKTKNDHKGYPYEKASNDVHYRQTVDGCQYYKDQIFSTE
jgi:hypothetical protein